MNNEPTIIDMRGSTVEGKLILKDSNTVVRNATMRPCQDVHFKNIIRKIKAFFK